jgi:hypothetical protein
MMSATTFFAILFATLSAEANIIFRAGNAGVPSLRSDLPTSTSRTSRRAHAQPHVYSAPLMPPLVDNEYIILGTCGWNQFLYPCKMPARSPKPLNFFIGVCVVDLTHPPTSTGPSCQSIDSAAVEAYRLREFRLVADGKDVGGSSPSGHRTITIKKPVSVTLITPPGRLLLTLLP